MLKSSFRPAFGMRALVLLSVLLSAGGVSALSFSAYAFLFPQVQAPLSLGSCTAFLEPVGLTGLAAMEPGFEQGILYSQSAVRTLSEARRMAQGQASPLFWGGSNIALYAYLSLACHRVAAEALSQAVAAVNANWPALDRCIENLEHAGVQLDGPIRGLYRQLDAERESIENRTGGLGLGGRVSDALASVESSARSDAALVAAIATLVGRQSVLQAQVSACRDSARVLKQVESDFSRLDDEVEQRLQDGQRLEAELDSQKISLVPQYAFSLQGPSAYTRTGWVQSFPEALQSAGQARQDAEEDRRKAQAHYKSGQDGFAERALSYAWRARESAEAAVTAWNQIDRQSQALESDLLRQADALRHSLALSGGSDSVEAAWSRQRALDLAQRPLPATRGERILQLADAVTALKQAADGRGRDDASAGVARDLSSLLDAAAADGLDVASEKSKLAQWESLASTSQDVAPDALDGVRVSVLQKAARRFGRLEALWSELQPYSEFVALDGEAFEASGTLDLEGQMGRLSQLEKSLDAARQDVQRRAQSWLADYLQRRLEFVQEVDAVVADAPTNGSFRISVQNDLAFGSDGPVLLKRPDSLPRSARLASSSGMRLLPDGLLLERVPAGSALQGEGILDDVLVFTRSVREETVYVSPTVARRAWTVTLDSQVVGRVFWTRDVAHDVDRLVASSGDAVAEPGRIKAVLPLRQGVNVFRLEFDVPQPVRIDKTADASGWSYQLQSRVPFELSLPWRFEESVACTPASSDSSVTSLSAGLYRLSANVTLHAFESRAYSVQLPCVADSLANQTLFLERLPGLSSESARVLQEARKALTDGRMSDAVWLLFQLQNPQAVADPLEAYRLMADDSDPVFRRLLEKADAAWKRSDSATLKSAVKELETYLDGQKDALSERIKAVCSKCPDDVASVLHDAKAALFLSDLSDARQQLAAAQQRLGQWQSEQAEQNRTRDELLDRIRGVSWPSLVRFVSAWSVAEPAVRWRGRQPLYAESKPHADALQALVKKLETALSKATDGKSLPLSSLESDFAAAKREDAALDALLGRLEADADAALNSSEMALQQFGSPAQQPLLDAVRQAHSQGRFASALYASEQLASALQRASGGPASSVTPATGLLGSRSLVEVGAGIGGLLVLGALAYWFRMRKREDSEPLEDIG